MLYRAVRGLARVLFWPLGLKSTGLHNLPKKGPVIVAANHVSNWDPIVVGIVLPRPVHFMAKAELFQKIWLAWLISGLHAFPVNRGSADRKAIRRALAVLEQNEVLGIFPEGFRNRSGDLKAQTGVAMIALKTGAPVVPIACLGTDCKIPWGWSSPLEVRVGKPVELTEFIGQKVNSANLDQISERIMKEIDVLLRN